MSPRVIAPSVAHQKSTKLAQLVLGAIVAVTVAGFGGVEPAVYLPMGMLMVAWGALVLRKTGWPHLSLSANCLLAALVLVPAFQLAPLPLAVVRVLSPARAAVHDILVVPLLGDAGATTLSVAPHATWLGLLKLVAYIAVFVVGVRTARSAGGSLLVPVLLVIGLGEAVFGLYQYLTRSAWVLGRLAPGIVAHGTYINRNNFAGLLTMILPFVAARVVMEFSGHRVLSRHSGGFGRAESGSWLLWLLAFLVLSLGILFSESRGGIVAGAAGVVAACSVVFARRSRRAGSVILILVFGLPLLYATWIGLDPVFARFEAAVQPDTIAGRTMVWKDTVALIRDYPLFGTGLGTYPWSSLHYQTAFLNYRYEHAHNDYLEFAADIGVPLTLLLFGSLWFLLFRVGRQALLTLHSVPFALCAGCVGSIVAVLLHAFVDFDLQMPGNALLFAWVLGTAVALCAAEEVIESPVRPFTIARAQHSR